MLIAVTLQKGLVVTLEKNTGGAEVFVDGDHLGGQTAPGLCERIMGTKMIVK